MSRLNNSSRAPLLCYVTDRHTLPATESGEALETLLAKIGAAAAAGVDWIQIREKDLSGRNCGLLTRETLQRAAKSTASKAAPTRILVKRHSLRGFLIFWSQVSVAPVIGQKVADVNLPRLDL